MPGLVADHRTDASVVHGIVGRQVEEGRLQDRGREDDLVPARVVVGIDRLRGHVPFVAIDRLAELGQVPVPLVDRVSLDVAHQVVAANLQGRIVAPLLRIADLGRKHGQFRQGLFLGRGAHPIEVLKSDPIGIQQVLDHLVHALLGFRREPLLDVQLAHRLAQTTFHNGDAPLPAGTILRNATEGRAVEREVRVRQILVEQARVATDDIELQPDFPGRQRDLVEQLGHRREVRRLRDDEILNILDAAASGNRAANRRPGVSLASSARPILL